MKQSNRANQSIYDKFQKHLTDPEITVFRGSWNNEVYDAIAAINEYPTNYIS